MVNDTNALVEACARAMAEETDLVWEVLPEKPDAACGHGMPEGCRTYWRLLASAVIPVVLEKVAEVAGSYVGDRVGLKTGGKMRDAILALKPEAQP